jgi:hypothetical protein
MITEILKHRISWTCDSETIKELDEWSIEHIEKLIKDGYSSGELYIGEEEVRGWWKIINWEDIALELYNALKDIPTYNLNEKKKKAITRFDDNWE